MTIADSALLVDSYLSWLRNTVSVEELDEGLTELTTPFLDRHNDHIQIYAERNQQGLFTLTDDGYILAELKSSGVENRGARREELFAELLSSYGVHLRDGELQVEAAGASLGPQAHNLVQAMLSLDDMFVLSQPHVEHIFLDDVTKFLDDKDIRYSARVKFAGRSGLDHLIDFLIPKSKKAPERLLQVVNSPRRDRIENLLFAASDTRSSRPSDTAYLAIINDASATEVRPDVLGAFQAYDVKVTRWSERDDMLDDLAA